MHFIYAAQLYINITKYLLNMVKHVIYEKSPHTPLIEAADATIRFASMWMQVKDMLNRICLWHRIPVNFNLHICFQFLILFITA